MANTGGGGRAGGGQGFGPQSTIANRGAAPTDSDGAKAGGSGTVVIKYKTDSLAVLGFFIS